MWWRSAMGAALFLVATTSGAVEKKDSAAALSGSVIVYDTMASAGLPETVATFVDEGRWRLVDQGAKTRPFGGDAAMVNRWLAVLICGDGTGVELYSKGKAGWTRRARLRLVDGA